MAIPFNTWPIIVGGCHRSGTSLVRRILNAHSRIHCGPEVKFFRDFYGDYPNDPLRHGRFVASARAILSEADLLELLGKAFLALHGRAAEQAGKARWADKNPENVFYLKQWEQLLGDRWFFLHVVRNPLDTLASIKQVSFPLIIAADLDARIAHYGRYTSAGLEFGATHPDRYRRVRYEELVQAPQATLERLMRSLGETFEPAQLEFNKFPQQPGLEDPKIANTSRIHAESFRRWPVILSHDEAQRIWDATHDLWALIDPEGEDGALVRQVDSAER